MFPWRAVRKVFREKELSPERNGSRDDWVQITRGHLEYRFLSRVRGIGSMWRQSHSTGAGAG